MKNKRGTNCTNRKFGLQCIAEFIVKGKWVFVGIFAALTIICCAMISQTVVVYDLSSYLAKGSDTSIAMDVLKSEFDDKGMAYVVVKNVDKAHAVEIATELSDIKGVASVAFLPDDTPAMPATFKDNNAMYTVTLIDYDSTEGAFSAIESIIEQLSDEEAYLTGQSAYSYFTRQETEESILKIGVVIVLAILLMLLFTSKSYFELVVMILVFGVSVALNMGTNFLFNYAAGGISYISNLVSLVLQLALSIDYSVIILHRFMEERGLGANPKTAAVNALTKGIPEVLSSSLTTIVGLCALMFMSLTIGVEIGISLAKSIVCSLVAVIFLMPALLVIFAKPLDKSKHKSFVPNVTRPARQILRARKVIVPLFLVVVVLACTGQFFNDYAFNMNGGSKIVDAQEEIKPAFGTLNDLVIIVPKGNYEQERALAEYVNGQSLIDGCTTLSTIAIADDANGNPIYLTDSFTKAEFKNVFKSMTAGTSYESMIEAFADTVFDGYLVEYVQNPSDNTTVPLIDLLEFVYNTPSYNRLLGDYADMLGQLVSARHSLESEHYARLKFNIAGEIEGEKTFMLIEELKEGVGDFYNEYYMTGESLVCYDMAQYFPRDNMLVSIFTVVFVLIILLLTFRNFSLPILLILAIQGGIWINFAIPFLAGNMTSFIGYLIICAVQMGATIDYAIVLTNRYTTIKDGFPSKFEAMAAAENAVFPTVITSGTILTITGFTLGAASSGVVAQMGSLLGIGTLTSMLIVLLILPSMLVVCTDLIDKSHFRSIYNRLRKNKTQPLQPVDGLQPQVYIDEPASEACFDATNNNMADCDVPDNDKAQPDIPTNHS